MALQLPFYKDPNTLPAPLPSKQDIQASKQIIVGGGEYDTRTVALVGQHFIVKYGQSAYQVEGENLLFIERNLQVPAPKLYAMWREEDGELYIVMEFIPGATLESLWHELTDSDKSLILGKLRHVFSSMRSLLSPGYYGSVSQGPLPHHLFYTSGNDPQVSGPFDCDKDLILGLVRKSRKNWAANKMHSYKADFFEAHLASALSGHPSTFTHSDLQRKNILVREIFPPNAAAGKDYRAFIVDWGQRYGIRAIGNMPLLILHINGTMTGLAKLMK